MSICFSCTIFYPNTVNIYFDFLIPISLSILILIFFINTLKFVKKKSYYVFFSRVQRDTKIQLKKFKNNFGFLI